MSLFNGHLNLLNWTHLILITSISSSFTKPSSPINAQNNISYCIILVHIVNIKVYFTVNYCFQTDVIMMKYANGTCKYFGLQNFLEYHKFRSQREHFFIAMIRTHWEIKLMHSPSTLSPTLFPRNAITLPSFFCFIWTWVLLREATIETWFTSSSTLIRSIITHFISWNHSIFLFIMITKAS